MKLIINDDRTFQDIDENIIRTSIDTLGFDCFIVLSQADEKYIQLYHEADGTFEVEYRKIQIKASHPCVVDGVCHECEKAIGDFHDPKCDQEECPACHGLLSVCGCD